MSQLLKRLTFWLALAPGICFAIGLSPIEVDSKINQPLVARIKLVGITPDELKEVAVSIVPSREFERQGTRLYYDHTDFIQQTIENGHAVLHLKSRVSIKEPFFSFLIRVDWPDGHLIREYTVLLDPPRTLGHHSKPHSFEQQPAYGKKSKPKHHANTASAVAGLSHYGPIQSGETLWTVANQWQPFGSNATVQQRMVAIYLNNPHAFLKNNTNGLMQGVRLNLPPQGAEDVVSPLAAELFIKHNNQLWTRDKTVELDANLKWAQHEIHSMSQGTAAPVHHNAKPVLKPVAHKAHLKLTSPTLDHGHKMTAEHGSLQHQLQLSKQALDSATKTNDELRQRLLRLEEQAASMQALLKLKDQELNSLNRQTQGSTPPAPTVNKPATAEPAAAATLSQEQAKQEALAKTLSELEAKEKALNNLESDLNTLMQKKTVAPKPESELSNDDDHIPHAAAVASILAAKPSSAAMGTANQPPTNIPAKPTEPPQTAMDASTTVTPKPNNVQEATKASVAENLAKPTTPQVKLPSVSPLAATSPLVKENAVDAAVTAESAAAETPTIADKPLLPPDPSPVLEKGAQLAAQGKLRPSNEPVVIATTFLERYQKAVWIIIASIIGFISIRLFMRRRQRMRILSESYHRSTEFDADHDVSAGAQFEQVAESTVAAGSEQTSYGSASATEQGMHLSESEHASHGDHFVEGTFKQDADSYTHQHTSEHQGFGSSQNESTTASTIKSDLPDLAVTEDTFSSSESLSEALSEQSLDKPSAVQSNPVEDDMSFAWDDNQADASATTIESTDDTDESKAGLDLELSSDFEEYQALSDEQASSEQSIPESQPTISTDSLSIDTEFKPKETFEAEPSLDIDTSFELDESSHHQANLEQGAKTDETTSELDTSLELDDVSDHSAAIDKPDLDFTSSLEVDDTSSKQGETDETTELDTMSLDLDAELTVALDNAKEIDKKASPTDDATPAAELDFTLEPTPERADELAIDPDSLESSQQADEAKDSLVAKSSDPSVNDMSQGAELSESLDLATADTKSSTLKEDAAAVAASSSTEDVFDSEHELMAEIDEVTIKLDLARAYIDLEDKEGAREILEEVLGEGDPEQVQEAKQMLAECES